MAIDTAVERRSAATTSVAWGPPSVTPDATKPVAWRSASGWGYSVTAAVEVQRLIIAAQAWAKVQPTDETWAKANPTSQTWGAK